jgi:hypothetical protein
MNASKTNFVVEAENAKSDFAESLFLAISHNTELTDLELQSLHFPTVLDFFMPIIQRNATIRSLRFTTCGFNGSLSKYASAWLTKTQFAVSDWTFVDCDLSSSEFLSFLQSFSHYPADISRLQFLKCSVSPAMLELLLTQICSSFCFYTLTELSILTINCEFPQNSIENFISSDFLIAQETIRFLDLCDCGLDVNLVLPLFCAQKTSVLSLSLSGNRLLSANGLESITNFQSISELTLSRLSCTGIALLGLFHVLAQANPSPIQLVLDNLSLTEPESFYDSLSNLRLNSLEMLSFSNNELSDTQFAALMVFIQSQEHLFKFGLGGTVSDQNKVRQFIELIRDKEIHGLSLCCSNGRPLGELLIPLFDLLLAQGVIRKLDVTRQAVGDAGLEVLVKLAKTCLEDLRWDGSLPSSSDVLLDIISRLHVSHLFASEWPKMDIEKMGEKENPEKWKQVRQQLEVLKGKFEKKLNPNSEVNAGRGIYRDVLGRSGNPGGMVARGRRQTGSIQIDRLGMQKKMLGYRSPFLRTELSEIFENKEVHDPMLIAMEQAETETSLASLSVARFGNQN